MNFEDIEQRTVRIYLSQNNNDLPQGTGFIVSEEGLVVTCDHVVVDENTRQEFPIKIQHIVKDFGYVFKADMVKRFRNNKTGRDVTVLKIVPRDDRKFPFFEIKDDYEVGDDVAICGFPYIFGSAMDRHVFRWGKVAMKKVSFENRPALVLDLIGVNGFSGSPVVDLRTNSIIGVFKGMDKHSPGNGFGIGEPFTRSDIFENHGI